MVEGMDGRADFLYILYLSEEDFSTARIKLALFTLFFEDLTCVFPYAFSEELWFDSLVLTHCRKKLREDVKMTKERRLSMKWSVTKAILGRRDGVEKRT